MAKRVVKSIELADSGRTPLQNCLERLGFSGYEPQIERALQTCEINAQITPKQVLTSVLSTIIEIRDSQKATMRLKMARFPVLLTLENFDFSRLTDKRIEAKIRELADCDWIRNKSNLYFHGETGRGKTHLSIALGLRATQKAYSTLFVPAKELFESLFEALQNGSYAKKLSNIQRNELLIIDDLGNGVVARPENAKIFYDILDGREGRKSTVITSNRQIIDWMTSLGGDPKCIRAAADRFLNNCRDFLLVGRSYRTGRFIKQREKDWGARGGDIDDTSAGLKHGAALDDIAELED